MADVVAVAPMKLAGELTELGRRYLHAKFEDATHSRSVAGEFAALAVLPSERPVAIVAIPSSTALAGDFAAALAQRWNVPVVAALRWTRDVPPLKHVPVADRVALIDAAFVASPLLGPVLLVDDVVRSGATFGEATRALRAAGAERVACLAMLRVD